MPLVPALRRKRGGARRPPHRRRQRGQHPHTFRNPPKPIPLLALRPLSNRLFDGRAPPCRRVFPGPGGCPYSLAPHPFPPTVEGRASVPLPVLAALSGVILAILRVLPLWDREAFRVDDGLLLTFAAFFLFVDHLETQLPGRFAYPHAVFALSVGLSQVLGNVPAAIFLAPLTAAWKAHLWGVHPGGFDGQPDRARAISRGRGVRSAGAFSSSTPSPRRRRWDLARALCPPPRLTGPSGKAKVKLGR